MRAEVDAATHSWCANLVRLGFFQERHINHAFLSALRSVARRAENDGLAVVIAVGAKRTPVPDRRTRLVWRSLTRGYGHDPQVIFDLFNEPAGPWRIWHDRMERLARDIRRHGGRNLFWAEGSHRGGTLRGVPRLHLTGVGPVAYSEHRPPRPHTRSQWNHSFGFAARRYPVVEGEWTNYSRANADWACWDDAPTAAPRFLRYLARRKFGLVGYNLAGPRLLESADLTDANHIRPDWNCSGAENEGAGHLIMTWLHSHNG
ncbi:MAG: cellulase family glycosylhydrolase [Actinobacteria bacterium]|nr:cellulase family glycosylhydrolase [Actinomycetota bacterium]